MHLPGAKVTGLLLLRARDRGYRWDKHFAVLHAVRVLLWRQGNLLRVKRLLSVCHMGTYVNRSVPGHSAC